VPEQLTPSPRPVRPTRPSLAVRLATVLVGLQCLLWLLGGLMMLAQGLSGDRVPTLVPVVDPVGGGIVFILLAAVAAGLQLAAVTWPGVLLSLVVGLAWLILGVLAAVVLPDPVRWVVGVGWLFVGVTMLRWSRRLAADSRSAERRRP
jgi:hypothetical protein